MVVITHLFMALVAMFAMISCNIDDLDYEQELDDCVNGKLKEIPADRGLIKVYLFDENGNDLNDPYYKNSEFVSRDNYSKLSKLNTLLVLANEKKLMGDMFYLYNYLEFNGYDPSMVLNSTSLFNDEIDMYMKKHSLTDMTSFVSTTTNEILRDFYRNYNYTLTLGGRMDIRSWKKSQITSIQESCDKLQTDLQETGEFGHGNWTVCYGNCCINQKLAPSKAPFYENNVEEFYLQQNVMKANITSELLN